MGLGVWGLGFWVAGLGLMVSGVGFRVLGLGCRVCVGFLEGSYRIWGAYSALAGVLRGS